MGFFGWLRSKFKRRPEKMSEAMLTDITRGMHHAASTTAAMIAQQYIRVIDQFFDKGDDGSLTAKMVKVHITGDHYIMIPLIALVSPKGLALEKMRVEMSVRITETELKAATDQVDNSGATRTSFKVELSPKDKGIGRRSDDLTEIEMIFTAGDPPEGMMRIIDEYTNLIKPIENGANGDDESHTYHTIGVNGPTNGNGTPSEDGPFDPDASPALEPIDPEPEKPSPSPEPDSSPP